MYTVTVDNLGPADATGVVLVDEVLAPSGVTVDSYDPSAGVSNGAEWHLGTLANGATATLTVTLTVGPSAAPGTDVISNTAAAAIELSPEEVAALGGVGR